MQTYSYWLVAYQCSWKGAIEQSHRYMLLKLAIYQHALHSSIDGFSNSAPPALDGRQANDAREKEIKCDTSSPYFFSQFSLVCKMVLDLV